VSKTKHLDTALDILKGKPGSRRAKGSTFTLYVSQDLKEHRWEGLLQGPRGKTVATFYGSRTDVERQAQEHVARVPGATLTIY
jgi:hypothetical protein